MPNVLITRPKEYAFPLAERLRGCGYEVFVEPLLTIKPVFNDLPNLQEMDAVLLTSRSALIGLRNSEVSRNDDFLSSLLRSPCYCIGEKTAEDAKRLGFPDVKIFDASALAGKSVLHICGEDVSDSVRQEIGNAGLNITEWQVYKAEAANNLSEALTYGMKTGGIDAVLIFSPRSARIFRSLIEKNGLSACCAGLYAIGISKAAVSVIGDMGFSKAVSAENATEDSVISCLQRIFPLQG